MSYFKNNKYRFVGFIGLLGLIGFRFFFTNDSADLFFFIFFAFFNFFIITPGYFDKTDERMKENTLKAAYIGFFIAMITLGLVGYLVSSSIGTREVITILCVAGWLAAFSGYSISFWYFERS